MINLESRVKEAGNVEHSGIDEEHENTERQHNSRQTEEDDQRADESVHDAEDESGDDEHPNSAVVDDAREQLSRDPESNEVDEPRG